MNGCRGEPATQPTAQDPRFERLHEYCHYLRIRLDSAVRLFTRNAPDPHDSFMRAEAQRFADVDLHLNGVDVQLCATKPVHLQNADTCNLSPTPDEELVCLARYAREARDAIPDVAP